MIKKVFTGLLVLGLWSVANANCNYNFKIVNNMTSTINIKPTREYYIHLNSGRTIQPGQTAIVEAVGNSRCESHDTDLVLSLTTNYPLYNAEVRIHERGHAILDGSTKGYEIFLNGKKVEDVGEYMNGLVDQIDLSAIVISHSGIVEVVQPKDDVTNNSLENYKTVKVADHITIERGKPYDPHYPVVNYFNDSSGDMTNWKSSQVVFYDGIRVFLKDPSSIRLVKFNGTYHYKESTNGLIFAYHTSQKVFPILYGKKTEGKAGITYKDIKDLNSLTATPLKFVGQIGSTNSLGTKCTNVGELGELYVEVYYNDNEHNTYKLFEGSVNNVCPSKFGFTEYTPELTLTTKAPFTEDMKEKHGIWVASGDGGSGPKGLWIK